MATLISASNISTAWLEAMQYLVENKGKASNLIVAIEQGQENMAIRARLNSFLKDNGALNHNVRAVADTVFPIDFYISALGEHAPKHLYYLQSQARRMESRAIGRTYFDRLIEWPTSGKPLNQLENVLGRLGSAVNRGMRNLSQFEIGVSIPNEDDAENLSNLETEKGLNLRLRCPESDKSIMGFPCLSHISLTLFEARIDMTAVYRNRFFISKAYGNYVGLRDLQNFISEQVGCESGELVCVATHADGEYNINQTRKNKIKSLLTECQNLNA